MSQENYTTKLLGMEDAIVTNVKETAKEIIISLEVKRRNHCCPNCGQLTNRVHDYRCIPLRDLSLRGIQTKLLYRKRRYVCTECGKRFPEDSSFVGRYQRFTYRVATKVIDRLHSRSSMTDIAKEIGISISGVARCMELVPQGKPKKLPKVLSFDEFKGNVNGERFQCILTAPQERRVLDILPKRTISTLQDYLKPFTNREEVEYVIMDMNRGYRDISKAFFPNAKIIIDRFHVVRYCTWAMDEARRRVQDKLLPETRRYFKRSRRLLLAHKENLSEQDQLQLTRMLDFSEKLWQAYALKEMFYFFMAAPNRSCASERLKTWFDAYHRLQLPEFKACYKMLRNWKEYILNSFDVPFSNGFTEGCNNAIKTLKRVAFGFRNFDNFRSRILLSVASPHPNI